MGASDQAPAGPALDLASRAGVEGDAYPEGFLPSSGRGARGDCLTPPTNVKPALGETGEAKDRVQLDRVRCNTHLPVEVVSERDADDARSRADTGQLPPKS
jgi:hypothetical protein